MKVIHFFAITAMAAAMFTSCSNDGDLAQSNYPSDNIIRVTTDLNNAKTRADENSGSLMEKDFLLTIVNKNPESSLAATYTYVNKKFSKSSGGTWSCGETLLWQNAMTPVDIVALAPAQETIFNGVYDKSKGFQSFSYSVAADQTTADAKNDLLYCYSPGFVPGEKLVDQKLNITFNHAFCLIDIIVTLGTEFNVPSVPTTSPITEVTIGGTKIAANVNVTSTTAIATPTDKAVATDIKATQGTFTFDKDNAKKSCTARFSCIVIPQTIAANDFKITLKTANKAYEWILDKEITLKSGFSHTLKLTMGNDVVLTTKESITAKPWDNGTKSDSTLETE